MRISEAHVGRTYPPTEPYLISREKIAEFAGALGDKNAAYVGSAAMAPPTFAAVLSMRAWESLFADPELDVALSRTIHGDQKFRWDRPLSVGDQVTSVLTIAGVRPRGAAAIISVEVELRVGTERVGSASSTLFHTWPEEEVA
ncbi:MAG: MaoC family dehydratase N-terminal domain-containing protein [Propioniciclava sp.]